MQSIIDDFYSAFAKLDAEKMTACYHEEVHFEDPAFGLLTGERAKGMWHMLCESQKDKDFRLTYSDIVFNEDTGSAHWQARYNFSQTGRKVHNKIQASFSFRDGKIIRHIDHFSMHKWAKQALGFKGALLGGTSFFKNKLQKQTNTLLDNYLAKKQATPKS